MSTKEEFLTRADAFERGVLRAALHIVRFFSILAALWFILCIWDGFSDGKTLEITDVNRDEIVYLMPNEIKTLDRYKDVSGAEALDTYSTFRDRILVIRYPDGTSFSCEIDWNSNLRRLILDNGYTTYPHTSYFCFDLLKLAASAAVCAACTFGLKKTKRITFDEASDGGDGSVKRYRVSTVSNKERSGCTPDNGDELS